MFRIILIRSDKVLVKRRFWPTGLQRSARFTEWSDLSRVRLKRMILAEVDKKNPWGIENQSDIVKVPLIQGTT